MLFPHTSALYALPSILAKEDVLFIDGIRYASEMVQISYVRLCESLLRLPIEEDPTKHRHLMTCAVHDAWSMIDSADRLASLVFRSTLMDRILDSKNKLLHGAPPVRKLRNTIQHIDALIANHAGAAWPVWGILRWFEWKNFPHTGISCQVLAGGHVTKRPFMLEGGRHEVSREAISAVVLSNKGVEVSLFDTKNSIRNFAVEVENLIKDLALAEKPSADRFADIFIDARVDYRKGRGR